jgi:hypothetical protein
VELLRALVLDADETNLQIERRSKAARHRLHILCSHLGLAHKSWGAEAGRVMWIRKPRGWAWEYTPPHAELEARLVTARCDVCAHHGISAAVMCSDTCPSLVCEGCLGVARDSRGRPASVHTWKTVEDCIGVIGGFAP